MTPSLPTFSIASASILPISLSPLALMVPTWAISFGSLVGFAIFLSVGDDRLDGLVDAALDLHRVVTRRDELASPRGRSPARARSPSWCRRRRRRSSSRRPRAPSARPCSRSLFSSSISLATVTPSLVTVGEPKLFSMTTLRPLGPSVTFTASARALTPARMRLRASAAVDDLLWLPCSYLF